MRNIFNASETMMHPFSGKEYSLEQIEAIASNYYRRDNMGPHTEANMEDLTGVSISDQPWCINYSDAFLITNTE